MTRTYDPDLDDVYVNRDGTIRWNGDAIGSVSRVESWAAAYGDWRAEIGNAADPEAWPGYRAAYGKTRKAAVAEVLAGVEAPL